MKRILPLFLAFALFGCEDFAGQMTVTQSFEAISKRGVLSKARSVVVPAGTHNVEIDADNTSATISLRLAGQNEKIRLNIPRNRIPKERGGFEVSASESGQPFNMIGRLDTDYQRTGHFRGWESCSRTIPREVCGYDSNGHWRCWIEYVTVYGQQQVEYYHLITLQHLEVELTNSSRQTLAAIDGRNSKTNKVYTYQGYCY